MVLPAAAASLPRARVDCNKVKKGAVSLEKELIEFPLTRVGETAVARIKVKNRLTEDAAVEILQTGDTAPFRVVHTVIEVL